MENNNKRIRKSMWDNDGLRSFIAALACILIGLLIGYIVLLIINPDNANEGIMKILKNFMNKNSEKLRLKSFGNTLINTAPLILCSLSILFAYKTGLFNIGAAGQYVIGAGAALYCAYQFSAKWYICILAAIVASAIWGAISGTLKSYLNVNEVISGIMLNWISLYTVNALMKNYIRVGEKDTLDLFSVKSPALIPNLGLGKFFGNNERVTIAIPLAIIIAIIIWIVLDKTRFGYEIRATGLNKNAARYAGMREKRNIILTMMIAGALAGIAASFLFLSGFKTWDTNQSSVPAMGFNGIAAAFLGGLNPIGVIFSSYFIQHITDGGSSLTGLYPTQISDMISAIIIYLCGFVLYMKLKMSVKKGTRGNRNAPDPIKDPVTPPAPAAEEEKKGGEA